MLFPQNKKKGGFTLVEMLIVIVIIGILAAALIPRLNSARGRANDTARKSALQQVSAVMVSYSIDYGVFPTCDNEDNACPLTELKSKLISAGITTIPLDPNPSRERNGLADGGTSAACHEIGSGNYGYIPIKKNGIPAGGFVIMAGTETIGGSNTVFDDVANANAGYTDGCLEANTVASNIITCDQIEHSTTDSTNIDETPCIAKKDQDVLRYIYVY